MRNGFNQSPLSVSDEEGDRTIHRKPIKKFILMRKSYISKTGVQIPRSPRTGSQSRSPEKYIEKKKQQPPAIDTKQEAQSENANEPTEVFTPGFGIDDKKADSVTKEPRNYDLLDENDSKTIEPVEEDETYQFKHSKKTLKFDLPGASSKKFGKAGLSVPGQDVMFGQLRKVPNNTMSKSGSFK